MRIPLLLLLLLATLLSGCSPGGGTVRRGRLTYNATEVFGASTPALALADAASRGDVEEIGRLIASGVDANTVGQHGITPLWWAGFAKNYEGFTALLSKGANPNAQRSEGYPIMYMIAGMSDARFLEVALKHGGDANLRDSESSQTPLFPAVERGLQRQVDLLLAAKANVNAQDPISGETIPMVAVGSRAD